MRTIFFSFVSFFLLLQVCVLAKTLSPNIAKITTKKITQTSVCNYEISGKVVTKAKQEHLISATLWIPELKKGVQTDENGNFVLRGLCEGVYTLTCTFIGCNSHTQKITILQSNTYKQENLLIVLEPAENHLEIVEVKEKKTSNAENEIQATSILSDADLDATRGLSLGESLKKIVGVSSLNTGSSIAKPMIQGMHSNRVLMMNNGVRQEGQQWGAEHAPEIDPFVASQLSVIKGAAAVRYGADAMGGVVLVEPKALQKNKKFAGEINLVAATNGRQGVSSGILEGKIKENLYWRVQGTLKKSGTISTPTYYLKNTGFEETNFSYALGYLKQKSGVELFYSQFNTNLGIFSGAHFGNLTDLRAIIAKGEPDEINKGDFSYDIHRPFQRIEHELFKLKSYYQAEKLGKFSLTFARQFNYRAEFDSHGLIGNAKNDNPQMALKITTYTTELLLEHKPKKNFYGTFGIFGMNQSNTYSGNFFIPFFRNYQAAIFAIEHWESGKWLLETGLRYDFRHLEIDLTENRQIPEFPSYNFSNISASFGTKYTLNNHFFVGINAAMAFRTPSVNELFSNGVHHGSASVEIGDRNLQTENAYNFSANVHYETEKLNIQANIYHNFIDNYIYLNPEKPETLTIRGAFPTFKYKQANVIIKGIDFSGSYQFTKNLQYQGKVALLRAYNYSIDNYLVLMPPDRYENTFRYEFDFAKAKYLKNSYVAINTVSVLGQYRVPENVDYTNSPAGYHLVNVEMGTKISSKKYNFQIGITANNLLNTSYRDYLNRFRYFADEMGRNISLKIKINFGA
jgi:iron complex outermembrane receptor protein